MQVFTFSHFHKLKYEIIPLQKTVQCNPNKLKSNKSILDIRVNDHVALKYYTESSRNLKYHLGYQVCALEVYCKFSSVHNNSRFKSGFPYIGTMQYKTVHQWITFCDQKPPNFLKSTVSHDASNYCQ